VVTSGWLEKPVVTRGVSVVNGGVPVVPSGLFYLKMPKSTPKCHKLTLEFLKMQNDPIWAYTQMAKKLSAPQKKAQNRPLGNYMVCPNSGN
jgi:hypothetical protein